MWSFSAKELSAILSHQRTASGGIVTLEISEQALWVFSRETKFPGPHVRLAFALAFSTFCFLQ
jgi:hypothetical protein